MITPSHDNEPRTETINVSDIADMLSSGKSIADITTPEQLATLGRIDVRRLSADDKTEKLCEAFSVIAQELGRLCGELPTLDEIRRIEGSSPGDIAKAYWDNQQEVAVADAFEIAKQAVADSDEINITVCAGTLMTQRINAGEDRKYGEVARLEINKLRDVGGREYAENAIATGIAWIEQRSTFYKIVDIEIYDHHDANANVCVIDSVDVYADVTIGKTTERILFQEHQGCMIVSDGLGHDQDDAITSLADAIRVRDGLVDIEEEKGHQDDVDLLGKHLKETAIFGEIDSAAYRAEKKARADIEPKEESIEVLVEPRACFAKSSYRLIKADGEYIVQRKDRLTWISNSKVSEQTAFDLQKRFEVPGFDDVAALAYAAGHEKGA